MKIRSLRKRWLIWQISLLSLVIAGFACVVYMQMRRLVFVEIDSDLLGAARVIEGTLRAYAEPPAQVESRSIRGDRDRRREQNELNEKPLRIQDLSPESIKLPRSLVERPGPPGHQPYFIVLDVDRNPIAFTPNHSFTTYRTPRREFEFHTIDPYREVSMRGPGRTIIVVGIDSRPQIDSLFRLAAVLMLAGGVVLVLGSVGAWWMVAKSMQSIDDISQTASQITGDNLGTRIQIGEQDVEFEQLSHALNAMLDRLEKSIEQQRQFTSDAAHELRTPVSILLLQTELALSRERQPAEYREALERCRRAADRLRGLSEDLLSVAQLEGEGSVQAIGLVDFSAVVAESSRDLATLAESRQVEFQFANNVASTTGRVRGNEGLLRRLVDNLIANAIVHNREGGSVNVSLEAKDNRLALQVQDDGPGIAPEHLSRIFDRFYRADTSRTRDSGGSGLGLSICKQIADQHDGLLEVESKQGEGTTFTFSIPSADNPA
ncbi:MAG: ATP-binding protein [Pirellulaceae bacterium]